jgi:hypothetical protein
MSEKKPTYWELLKHPKWQEKRLRIMERAGFKCEECDTDKVTLNVHHKYYTKGANPWEYPDHALQCLCEPCHGEVHEWKEKLSHELAMLSTDRLQEVLGYVRGLQMEAGGGFDFEVENYAVAMGMVRVFLSLSRYQTAPPCIDLLGLSDGPNMIDGNMLIELCGCVEAAEKARVTYEEWKQRRDT